VQPGHGRREVDVGQRAAQRVAAQPADRADCGVEQGVVVDLLGVCRVGGRVEDRGHGCSPAYVERVFESSTA